MDEIKKFRLDENHVLIGTDLIARGIDAKAANLFINFEMPDKIEEYLHRIGRSGRFGRRGIAINIIDKTERRIRDDIITTYMTKMEPLSDSLQEILDNISEQ